MVVCETVNFTANPSPMESEVDLNNTVRSSAEVETCNTENGEMLDSDNERELINQEPDGTSEPYVGMEFESEQAALKYYDAYAHRLGFIIRRGNCHRSGPDGSITSRRFVCNKEGFRISRKSTTRPEARRPREVTREGCKAMIIVGKEKSGKWVIRKAETMHTHPLGPAGKGREGTIHFRSQDEKDKKIRELSAKLREANWQLAECREKLEMVLKGVEQHTDHLTKSVQDIIETVKEIEAEDDEEL